MCSTERSESNTSDPQQRVVQSRIPTEPWQITKKHLNLSPQEIASLGSGEPGERPENMDSKVLKVIRFSVFPLREGIGDFCIDSKIKQITIYLTISEPLLFKS